MNGSVSKFGRRKLRRNALAQGSRVLLAMVLITGVACVGHPVPVVRDPSPGSSSPSAIPGTTRSMTPKVIGSEPHLVTTPFSSGRPSPEREHAGVGLSFHIEKKYVSVIGTVQTGDGGQRHGATPGCHGRAGPTFQSTLRQRRRKRQTPPGPACQFVQAPQLVIQYPMPVQVPVNRG